MRIKQRERLDKIYLDPLYLLSQSNTTFTISGSTANIYTITIANNKITCDCQDAKTHALKQSVICKHCCFVLVKVLKIPITDLETTIFATLKFNEHVMNSIKTKCDDTLEPELAKLSFTYTNKRSTDDDCPICYDSLSENTPVECPSCNNPIHKACMEKWLQTNKSCVYCRSDAWTAYKK